MIEESIYICTNTANKVRMGNRKDWRILSDDLLTLCINCASLVTYRSNQTFGDQVIVFIIVNIVAYSLSGDVCKSPSFSFSGKSSAFGKDQIIISILCF